MSLKLVPKKHGETKAVLTFPNDKVHSEENEVVIEFKPLKSGE